MAGQSLLASPTAVTLGHKVAGAGGAPMGSPAVPKGDAVMAEVRRLPTDLDRFLYLRGLQ